MSSAEKLVRATALSSKGVSEESLIQAAEFLESIPKEDKESKQAQQILTSVRKRIAAFIAVRVVLGPDLKKSSWDGSVRCVDEYLRKTLNDYHDSEWSPVTKLYVKKEPFWVVRLKIRVRNAFGAKIVKDAFFFITQIIRMWLSISVCFLRTLRKTQT